MTLPLLSDHHILRRPARWLLTSNAAGRDTALDSTTRAAPILPAAVPLPTAQWRLHLTRLTDRLLRLHRAPLLHSQAAAKSP